VTWFFVLVVIAVIGVAALVATGRGGEMAEVFDDRPDVRVKAGGRLGAEDLEQVRFTTAFRGYRMAEVDALLARLSAELADRAERERPEPEAGPTDRFLSERPEQPENG
jgi:DivIVA domain-containing protein